jgi:serine/threonine protein phosphatase PrpC
MPCNTTYFDNGHAVSLPLTYLKILDALSDPSGEVNEDNFGYINSSAWVLDGATGLGNRKILSETSDARVYVEAINDAFLELASEPGRTIKEIVQKAIEVVSGRFAQRLKDTAALPYEVPSATMVFVRVTSERFEYATLGDCRALVETRTKGVVTIENTQIEELDRRVIEEITDLHNKGIKSFQEIRKHITSQLRANRALMNRQDGYWVLSFSPEATNNMLCRSFEASDIARVLLVSDGFYHLVSTFHLFTNSGLVQAASDIGLAQLKEKLRAVEKTDPECIRYPRLKPADDATAVLLELCAVS